MSNQTTQKLTECRKCKEAGFPNQMIGFSKSNKVKPDGKPYWDLRNADMSMHIHKSPTEKFEQIEVENDKPPARPLMSKSVNANESERLELTQEEIATLKQFVSLLKVVK